jgi:hypothetical protein
MDRQGVVGRGARQALAAGLMQGLHERRQGRGGVGEEAPSALGAGEGAGQTRQGGGAGRQRGRAAQVLVHQLDIAASESLLKGRKGKAHPLMITNKYV